MRRAAARSSPARTRLATSEEEAVTSPAYFRTRRGMSYDRGPRPERRASLLGVPPVRKILLAALLFLAGYAAMQLTRCDGRADEAVSVDR